MMKGLFLLGFLILGFASAAVGQVFPSLDTAKTYRLVEQEKYFGRVFENLPAVHHSDTAYNPLLNEMCSSLAGCMAVLTTHFLDSTGAKTVYARLEEMASRFYLEGTPFILVHGYESIENAKQLNQSPNKYNLIYFGDNDCLTFGWEGIGRQVFNSKIYELVGYQEEQPLEERKKRKK